MGLPARARKDSRSETAAVEPVAAAASIGASAAPAQAGSSPPDDGLGAVSREVSVVPAWPGRARR
jgi:hypothetical protein